MRTTEQIEHDTEVIQQANVSLVQLTEITKVCLLYNNGAPADSCMERIKQIVLGEPNE